MGDDDEGEIKRDWDWMYKALRRESTKCVVNFNETIVVDQGFPTRWVFTKDKTNTIGSRKVRFSAVKEKFVKTALAYTGNKEGYVCVIRINSGSNTCIYKLLNEKDLEDFIGKLADAPDKSNLMTIQQYVHAKGGWGTYYESTFRHNEGSVPTVETVKVYPKKNYINSIKHPAEGMKADFLSTEGGVSLDDMQQETLKVTNTRLLQRFDTMARRMSSYLENTFSVRMSHAKLKFIMDENDEIWLTEISDISTWTVERKTISKGDRGPLLPKAKCGGDYCYFGIKNLGDIPVDFEDCDDDAPMNHVTYRTVHLARLETPFGPSTRPDESENRDGDREKHMLIPLFVRGAGRGGTRLIRLGSTDLVDYSNSGDGLHLLVLRRFDLKEVYKRTYDTNTHDFESDHMASLLTQYNTDYFIIITSAGHWERKVTENLRVALIRCGANPGTVYAMTHDRTTGHPFTLIGIPEMGAIEFTMPSNSFDPFAEVSTFLVTHPKTLQYIPMGIPCNPDAAQLKININKNHPTHFYGEVKVCDICYQVYTKLNKIRSLAEIGVKKRMPKPKPKDKKVHDKVNDGPSLRGLSFLGLSDDGGVQSHESRKQILKPMLAKIPGKFDRFERKYNQPAKKKAAKNRVKMENSGSPTVGGESGAETGNESDLPDTPESQVQTPTPTRRRKKKVKKRSEPSASLYTTPPPRVNTPEPNGNNFPFPSASPGEEEPTTPIRLFNPANSPLSYPMRPKSMSPNHIRMKKEGLRQIREQQKAMAKRPATSVKQGRKSTGGLRPGTSPINSTLQNTSADNIEALNNISYLTNEDPIRKLEKSVNLFNRSYVRYPLIQEWSTIEPVRKTKQKIHGALHSRVESPLTISIKE
eukprot:GFYU01008225.1.p1 GENE.GFYU01008225.1~~GFYU01008225.1.p1  ORF type:complete len:867 (+),score=272.44 GFYU01008225.1:283-2883(+)